MLKRKYSIAPLAYDKKMLTIEFDDNSRYGLLSVFLVSEVHNFEAWVKEQFDKVLSGECESNSFSGNICDVEITPDTTNVYDLFDDNEEPYKCEVDTKELRSLIDEWCEISAKFKETGELPVSSEWIENKLV
ncbi:MAG: hypothetical protein UE295_08755 [Acutalibacteraceae bacterium]|nr:hypothetical protein [Acutalibacteraceae bacterium]